MNSKILIVGFSHHNTLGMIESLALKCIKPDVIVVDERGKTYIKSSKNYSVLHVCKTESELIACMLEHYSNQPKKTIVLSAADMVSVYLDRNYDQLKEYFYLPLPLNHIGELEQMMSKEYMYNLALKVGLTVPFSIAINDNNIPAGVQYPCITKGIDSITGSKSDLHVCHNEKELAGVLNDTHHCERIQIQKFVQKEYEFQLLGCSFNNGNEVIITGRTTIVRPNGIDNTHYLTFDKCEPEMHELLGRAKEFIRETSYNGPFSMEFLKSTDGNSYFMELNFRNDGNAYVQTAAGTNIPYIIYLYYNGLDYKDELRRSSIKKAHWFPEYVYTLSFLHREFGIREYLSSLHNADCYSNYYHHDRKVFFVYLCGTLATHSKILLKKIFRK